MGKIVTNQMDTEGTSKEKVQSTKKVKQSKKISRVEPEIVEPEIVEQQKSRTKKQDDNREDYLENLQSIRPVGDTECEYSIYIEDYANTYLDQYAHMDTKNELSAAIIGEYYPESKEIIICGIIPIPQSKIAKGMKWITDEALTSIYDEKDEYFPDTTTILGWLHMQQGYGIALTMEEVKVHREFFDIEGTVLLLVDPINKLQSFFVYERDTLKEQTGYYIYYDKNPSMHQYMLDKPLTPKEAKEQEDSIVSQFREIGQRRKNEYNTKKKTNFTVITASITLLALSAVLLRVVEQDKLIGNVMNNLDSVSSNIATKPSLPDNSGNSKDDFVFENAEDNEPVIVQELVSSEVVNTEPTEELKELDLLKDTVLDNSEQEPAVVEVANVEDIKDVEEASTEVEEAEVKVAEVKEAKVEEPEIKIEEAPVVELEVKEEPKEVAEEITLDEELEEGIDYIVHVVQSGETLRKISLNYFDTELRTKDIMAINDFKNADNLSIGEEIKVPVE